MLRNHKAWTKGLPLYSLISFASEWLHKKQRHVFNLTAEYIKCKEKYKSSEREQKRAIKAIPSHCDRVNHHQVHSGW